MLPAHQLQGELAIPVHTYMQSCPHTHAPAAAANDIVLQASLAGARLDYNGVFSRIFTQRPFWIFDYFVLPKALKPY